MKYFLQHCLLIFIVKEANSDFSLSCFDSDSFKGPGCHGLLIFHSR